MPMFDVTCEAGHTEEVLAKDRESAESQPCECGCKRSVQISRPRFKISQPDNFGRMGKLSTQFGCQPEDVPGAHARMGSIGQECIKPDGTVFFKTESQQLKFMKKAADLAKQDRGV